jgi:predicted DNA-binding transcriptional regulator AlpA
METLPLLLRSNQVAGLIGISSKQLRIWVLENRAPPRIRVGKRYYWPKEMVNQWIKAMAAA